MKPSHSSGPLNFDAFMQLPPEMQGEVASSLSEKEVFNLVATNPEHFFAHMDKTPILATKFYNYLFNNKIFRAVGEGEKPSLTMAKMVEVVKRFFHRPKLTPTMLMHAFEHGQVEKYVTRLNLFGYSEKQLEIILGNLPDQTNIESIDITGSKITTEQMALLIQKCPKLRDIQAIGNVLIDMDFSQLPPMPNVKHLDFYRSSMTPTQLSDLLQKAPNVEKLSLMSCRNIEHLDLSRVPQLAHLKQLQLMGSLISSQSLVRLLEKAPNIESLDLSRCIEFRLINDPHFPAGTRLSELKELKLEASEVSETFVIEFLKRAKLETLSIPQCTNINLDTLMDEPGLEHVQKIDIQFLPVTKAQLTRLLSIAPLQELKITQTEELKDFDFSKYPNVTVLHS